MKPAQHILVLCFRLYQRVLSPAKIFLFGPGARCRYSPTCSEYAVQAIQTHGALTGLWLSVKRLGRCHPWGGCGYDPVPARPVRSSTANHGSRSRCSAASSHTS